VLAVHACHDRQFFASVFGLDIGDQSEEKHLMLWRRLAYRVSLIVVGCANLASAQIFTDDMSTSANWTIAKDSDSTFQFGYDYSQDGLSPAPNGSDSIGLKFTVNNNQPQEIDQIGAFHFDEAYTGQFTFRVDIWSNWAPDGGTVGTGTTEFVGVSVGHDGFAPGPFGASLIYTGDGDAAATDYRLYKDEQQLQSESGQYAVGTAAGARDSSNPIFMEAFPSINIADAVPDQGASGTVAAGAAGFQWMTVNVEVDTEAIGPSGATSDPGFARFSMRSDSSGNTVVIGTVDNSNDAESPTIMSGSIGLLMSDLFSSVAVNPAYSFGIFDNVQVFDGLVPLPSGGLPGDYNEDSTVDAADYTVWRNMLGTSLALPNENPDALTPGVVDQEDYDFWKSQFGATAGSGSLVAGNVPEPASAGLLAIGLFALLAGRPGCGIGSFYRKSRDLTASVCS